MRKLFFILLTGLLCKEINAQDAFNHYFRLLPRPQKTTILRGEGILFSDIRNFCLKNTTYVPVVPDVLANLPFNTVQQQGSVILTINKDLNIPSDEGYMLEVKNRQVFIQARDQRGLFYGIQTLGQFDTKVIEERNYELCFEMDRWFDLIRKHILKEKSLPEIQPNFSEDDYLFPIPSNDIRVNPLMVQNPGY